MDSTFDSLDRTALSHSTMNFPTIADLYNLSETEEGEGHEHQQEEATTSDSLDLAALSHSTLNLPTINDIYNLSEDEEEEEHEHQQEQVTTTETMSVEDDLAVLKAYYDWILGSLREYERLEVTATDLNYGIDPQGINWNNKRISRSRIRDVRYTIFDDYHNLQWDSSIIEKDIRRLNTDGDFYRFRYSTLDQQCIITHFQLCNLLWATSKNDVYYGCGHTVCRWNPISRTGRQIFPMVENNVRSEPNFNMIITTLCCKENVLFVGGTEGEYYWKSLDTSISHDNDNDHNDNKEEHKGYGFMALPNNGITNYVDIAQQRSGRTNALIANNDKTIRVLDIASETIVSAFPLTWEPNCVAQSPDKNLLCIVGDDKNARIINLESGESIAELTGHIDYSFSCAWHPNGRVIATGNQDKTTRLYDTRKLSESFATLSGRMGSIRSLRFSDDGAFLAMAETADFVHLIDTQTWDRSQVIDMFGRIGGIAFTPDDAHNLYIAYHDEDLGGIMNYERNWSSYDAIQWLP